METGDGTNPPTDQNLGGDGDGNREGEGGTWNGEAFDAEKARGLIDNLRKNERQLKKELEQSQKSLKEREEAEKTELEKAQSRLTELEKEIETHRQREREANLRGQVKDVAEKLGAHYPEDMYVLVQSGLEVSDDGTVRNAEAALKELKKSRPALFKDEPRVPGRTRSGAAAKDSDVSEDMNALIRQRAGIR